MWRGLAAAARSATPSSSRTVAAPHRCGGGELQPTATTPTRTSRAAGRHRHRPPLLTRMESQPSG